MMTLNHGFSGYLLGRVMMPALQKKAPLSQAAISWAFFLGAMMPDLDILSKVLLGRGDYFAGLWYSHRQLSHSLVGTLLLALPAAALLWRPLAAKGGRPFRMTYPWLVGCFWAGGWIHIFGDYFTPAMSMPVFWPWREPFGGLSNIGWFSPYLLVLFGMTLGIGWAARGALLGLAAPKWAQLRRGASAALWVWYAAATVRWVTYLLGSEFTSHGQWAEYQRTLLPEAVITPLYQGVREIWYWLTG